MKKSRKQRREERKAVKRLERKLTKPKLASFSVRATAFGGELTYTWKKILSQLRDDLRAEEMERALDKPVPGGRYRRRADPEAVIYCGQSQNKEGDYTYNFRSEENGWLVLILASEFDSLIRLPPK